MENSKNLLKKLIVHAYLLHSVTTSCDKYVLKLTSILDYSIEVHSRQLQIFLFLLRFRIYYIFTLCATSRVRRSLHGQFSKIELSAATRIHAHFPVLGFFRQIRSISLLWGLERGKEERARIAEEL